MNRRQVLQTISGIAVAGAFAQVGTAQAFRLAEDHSSAESLARLLHDTIGFCRSSQAAGRQFEMTVPENVQYATFQAGQLCEVALERLQNGLVQSPAFWQACADSVERLSGAIQDASDRVSDANPSIHQTLHQLQINLVQQSVATLDKCPGL